MSGYTRDELLGMRVSDVEAVESPADTAARIERLRKIGFDRFETRHRRKDGGVFHVSAGARFLGLGRDMSVAFVQDITERLRSVDALRESEGWLRMSQEIAKLGNYVFDLQADHWTSSPTLDTIFGVDPGFPRRGADWLRIVHPDDRPAMGRYLEDLLSGGSRFDNEYRVVDQATKRIKWVHGIGELGRSTDGTPLRLVGTIQDVTDRKVAEESRLNLQAQLARSARLAAMGTLVAGVAHEINNPLSIVTGSMGVVMEDVRKFQEVLRGSGELGRDRLMARSNEMLEAVSDARVGADRIAQIVKDLVILGRPEKARGRINLADVVKGAPMWVPPKVRSRATLRTEAASVPDVMASASHMEQILVNLCTNAALAIPDGQHGEIVVRLGLGSPDMVRIEVADNGPGIPPELMEKIFDPFFTTRTEGKGTGLGLSICQAIVKAHGGTITVESEVGKGSTFRVELPVAPAEPVAAA